MKEKLEGFHIFHEGAPSVHLHRRKKVLELPIIKWGKSNARYHPAPPCTAPQNQRTIERCVKYFSFL